MGSNDAEAPTTVQLVQEEQSSPLEPTGWGKGPSPPDPNAFSKAKQHRKEAEARGEDPYADYKKKVTATEPSSSGIERIYRWAEKKLHHTEDRK